MVEGGDAIGDLVTGAALARALEPEAGEAQGGHQPTCLNCGTALIGAYCHRCGQKGRVRRTLSAFWHDLIHGVLHVEGKIWRTLPLLAWRPGELTRRYAEGERARFVSPMALFLFSVFLMFATFSTLGGPFPAATTDQDRAEAIRDFREDQAEFRNTLQELRAERARLVAARQATANIDARIADINRVMKRQEQLFRQTMVLIGAEASREAQFTEPFETSPTPGDQDLDALGFQTGWPPLDAAITRANENPSLLIYKLQNNAYKFSWALIPISIPFVWMLFLHRRRYWRFHAYDHTVFVTYSIAFMSLGLVVLALLRPLGVGDAIIWSAIAFIPPVHIYRQLRGAYSLSRWSALWRTFTLLVFAGIAAGLFFTLLLAMGVLG